MTCPPTTFASSVVDDDFPDDLPHNETLPGTVVQYIIESLVYLYDGCISCTSIISLFSNGAESRRSFR